MKYVSSTYKVITTYTDFSEFVEEYRELSDLTQRLLELQDANTDDYREVEVQQLTVTTTVLSNKTYFTGVKDNDF